MNKDQRMSLCIFRHGLKTHKKLMRDRQNAVIGGVCAGVANSLGTYKFLILLVTGSLFKLRCSTAMHNNMCKHLRFCAFSLKNQNDYIAKSVLLRIWQ